MIARLALVAAIALLGAFAFVAGSLAPETVRAPIAALAQRLAASAPAAAAAPPAAAPAATAEAQPTAKDDAIPWERLLLPTPAPKQGEYALQLGQFASAAAADATVAERAKTLGLPYAAIPVVDRGGQRFWIAALGRFGRIDDALAARWKLSSAATGAVELPPVILLPASKPPADQPNRPRSG